MHGSSRFAVPSAQTTPSYDQHSATQPPLVNQSSSYFNTSGGTSFNQGYGSGAPAPTVTSQHQQHVPTHASRVVDAALGGPTIPVTHQQPNSHIESNRFSFSQQPPSAFSIHAHQTAGRHSHTAAAAASTEHFGAVSNHLQQGVDVITPENLAAQKLRQTYQQTLAHDNHLAIASPTASQITMPNSEMFAANRICPWCGHFCHEGHIPQCDKRRVQCNICLQDVPWLQFESHFKKCEATLHRITMQRVERRLREAEEQKAREAAAMERRKHFGEDDGMYYVTNFDNRGVSFDPAGPLDINDPRAQERGRDPNSPPVSGEYPAFPPGSKPPPGIVKANGGGITYDSGPSVHEGTKQPAASDAQQHDANDPMSPSPAPAPPHQQEAAANVEPSVASSSAIAPSVASTTKSGVSKRSTKTAATQEGADGGSPTESSGGEKYPCKWCGAVETARHEERCANRVVVCKRCGKNIKNKNRARHKIECRAEEKRRKLEAANAAANAEA